MNLVATPESKPVQLFYQEQPSRSEPRPQVTEDAFLSALGSERVVKAQADASKCPTAEPDVHAGSHPLVTGLYCRNGVITELNGLWVPSLNGTAHIWGCRVSPEKH